MQRYKIILPVIAVVLLVAWYAFRPERLFVNQRVHEELPTAQAADSPARPLASGKFHSVAHATSGTAAVYQLARWHSRAALHTLQDVKRPGCSCLSLRC